MNNLKWCNAPQHRNNFISSAIAWAPPFSTAVLDKAGIEIHFPQRNILNSGNV